MIITALMIALLGISGLQLVKHRYSTHEVVQAVTAAAGPIEQIEPSQSDRAVELAMKPLRPEESLESVREMASEPVWKPSDWVSLIGTLGQIVIGLTSVLLSAWTLKTSPAKKQR